MARSLIWAIHTIKELWWLWAKIQGHSDIYSKKHTTVVVTPKDDVSFVAEIFPKFKKEVNDYVCDDPCSDEPWLRVDSYGNYEVRFAWADDCDVIQGHTSDNDGFWLAEAIKEVLEKLEGS